MSQDLVPAFHAELGEMEEPQTYRQMVEEFMADHDGRHPMTAELDGFEGEARESE